MSFDWKGVLRGIAPALATALGGPAAGKAAAIIGAKLLGNDNATVEEVAAAISGATPEQIESLRKLDHEFVLSLVDKATRLEEIEAGDRSNARAREIALHDPITGYLAGAITFGFFALLTLLGFRHVPGENKDILMTMVGVLGTAWIGVTTYYFGSSSGSRAKDAVIRKISDK